MILSVPLVMARRPGIMGGWEGGSASAPGSGHFENLSAENTILNILFMG